MSPPSILLAISLLVAPATQPVERAADVPPDLPRIGRIEPLTAGPKHHFVGYYGITPWNHDGSRLFCLEADFGDRLVEANDRAAIHLIDPLTCARTFIAETVAWNMQQGSMLQWLPPEHKRLVYNDRIDGQLVSVIRDISGGERRTIDRPLAALSHDGRWGVSINFDRLRQIRPVTGYAGGAADGPVVARPADEGLCLVEIATGRSRLLVSIDACLRAVAPPEHLNDQPSWLEHPAFSPDGGRVFFIARAIDPKGRRLVSIPMVVAPDGSGLRALLPAWAAEGASHYDWLDGRRLVLTRQQQGTWRHLLIDTDGIEAPITLAPDTLTRDGHCTISPDGRWMITDTYPDAQRRQHLFVLEVATGRAARLGSFYAPPQFRGDWRCDLHPRWSRDSRSLCIDSAHDGTRQVYVVQLSMPAR